jgi:hypothetical protein
MFTRFSRRDDGIQLSLTEHEATVLRDLVGQVDELLAGGTPDPGADAVRDRLFPRAYLDPTADAQEADFQSVVHDDLVRSKSEAAAALEAALDAGTVGRKGVVTVVLDDEDVERWVSALNDIRLALGTTLGVTEDMPEAAANDPRAAGLDLYDWLTWLQGSLVEVLLAGFGGEPTP